MYVKQYRQLEIKLFQKSHIEIRKIDLTYLWLIHTSSIELFFEETRLELIYMKLIKYKTLLNGYLSAKDFRNAYIYFFNISSCSFLKMAKSVDTASCER